ncbi:MAG: integrase core domain-containing protein [Bacteroidota bacterium]|nr:integrase core domain-containing protein [Bacteroidota bacterium]
MDKAVNMQFPDGIDRSAPYLLIPSIVSDNGCQPTSKAFAEYEKALGLEHVFTSYCNPKGDADTERVIHTIKEDLLWINEFKTQDELKEWLSKWQHDYNHVFPHSSLENCTPVEYEERWYKGTEPQKTLETARHSWFQKKKRRKIKKDSSNSQKKAKTIPFL